MGGDQLMLLEKRIEKAIELIEELKSREKKFTDEKRALESKIEDLTKEIEAKDSLIDELKNSQKFLKDKIEVILDKLESIEVFEGSSDFNINPLNDGDGENVIESFSETKIIEDENIVDLKEINDKDEGKSETNDTETNLTEEKLETDNEESNSEQAVKEEEKDITAPVSKEEENNSFEHKDTSIEENSISEETIEPEEDLKVIDGGKSLFENDGNIDNNGEVFEQNNEKKEGGFLFNTGTDVDNLKREDDWFKNNPFI